MTRYLNDDLLAAFETRLRDRGATITETWAPGLTDAEIDQLLLPVDIDLPEEARRWWRWHNGSHGAKGQPDELLPGRDLYALHSVADIYADFRDPRNDAGEPEGLLAPVGEKPIIWFHCDGARDAPVPIYSQNDWTAPLRLVLPSIGELVTTWTDYLDRGIFQTNPDGTWAYRHDLPQDVLQLGVF